MDLPINLYNVYLIVWDTNEDILSLYENLFFSATGGTIKNITISVPSGNVPTLSFSKTESLLLRDTIIANWANVGSINGFGLVFFFVIQYVGNSTGIVNNNINRLLLSSTGWFGNNLGTFERFTETLLLI